MGRTFEKPKSGEWVQPVRRGYKMGCCDCGLVHRMDFRIHHGRAQFRAFRAPRSTASMRRAMTLRRDVEIRRRFMAGRTFGQLYREYGQHVVNAAIRAML